MNFIKEFQSIYNRDPEGMAFCPYRICPIGAHSDHQLGRITGLAIDQGIHMAYRPKRSGIVGSFSELPDPRTVAYQRCAGQARA